MALVSAPQVSTAPAQARLALDGLYAASPAQVRALRSTRSMSAATFGLSSSDWTHTRKDCIVPLGPLSYSFPSMTQGVLDVTVQALWNVGTDLVLVPFAVISYALGDEAGAHEAIAA